jgi:hypothetical protein
MERTVKKTIFLIACGISIFLMSYMAFAEELKPIQLPKPQMDGGRPLMQVLKDRFTNSRISEEVDCSSVSPVDLRFDR